MARIWPTVDDLVRLFSRLNYSSLSRDTFFFFITTISLLLRTNSGRFLCYRSLRLQRLNATEHYIHFYLLLVTPLWDI